MIAALIALGLGWGLVAYTIVGSKYKTPTGNFLYGLGVAIIAIGVWMMGGVLF